MKQLTKVAILISIAVITLSIASCNSGETKKDGSKKSKIAVVLPVTIDAFEQLKSGLKEVCKDEFEIQFYSAEADPAKFETVIQTALLNKPDYLVTIGTQLTNSAFGPKFNDKLPIVIAAAISSPDLVDALVKIGITPPRKSPVAIISDSPKESIYELFNRAIRGFLPNIKNVGILYNPSEINSKGTADNIAAVLNRNSITVNKAALNNLEDVEKVTQSLILQNVDAVIIPHDKNAVTKATSIVKICDQKSIPVFSLDDGTVKKDGVCVGVSVNYRIIGELIGQTIIRIEKKESKPEDIPVISIDNARIYMNVKKANQLGIKEPESLSTLIEKN